MFIMEVLPSLGGCVGEVPLTRAAREPSEMGGNDKCRLGVAAVEVLSSCD